MPAPSANAAGIHFHTTFGYQLGDVLVGKRISQVPADALHDHRAWEMAAFERIGRGDGHRLLPYQTRIPEFATEPKLFASIHGKKTA